MENNSKAVTVAERSITYLSNGEEVKLNPKIVRNYLTRGNGNVTDQEVVMFINLCKFQKLNPFLNEAYLIKFNGANPQAQMVVSKEALFKRAEENHEYDGIQAGIITKHGEDYKQVEGTFMEEGDELVGGWARVYRKDRKYPIVSTVNLKDYDKGQSIWKDKKATMIAKVAKVQALREAFPKELGAMYTDDEQGINSNPQMQAPKPIDFEEPVEVESTPFASQQEPETMTIKSDEPAQPTQPKKPAQAEMNITDEEPGY